jgi:hypothetical protein
VGISEKEFVMNSIVSYPARGIGGSSRYRGNCAPQVVADLIDQFHWSELSDYMCGSGTTEDVCNQKGILSHCYDLNRGFDLMSMEIPERNEAIFWHPPYGDMVQYSDNMYRSSDIIEKYGIDPAKSDISRIHDWDEFVRAMNFCCMKQFTSLERGGRMAILMGDMKRKGKLYSMLCDIAKPGTIENIVIKAQHNCMSSGKTYSNRSFIPIVHEYILILRKDSGLYYPVAVTKKCVRDIRDVASASWRDVVADVMDASGRPMALGEIYSRIAGHVRCESNGHWKEKVRQTLQAYPIFKAEKRGVWALQTTVA